MQTTTSIKLRFAKAVKYIREEVCRELPIQQLHILLEIANEEGINTATLMRRCDIQSGPLSRNIKHLSVFMEQIKGVSVRRGLELVEPRIDVYNRKGLVYYLTAKGKQVVDVMLSILGGNNEPVQAR